MQVIFQINLKCHIICYTVKRRIRGPNVDKMFNNTSVCNIGSGKARISLIKSI